MMNKKINYSISSKVEASPIGYIYNYSSGETLNYFCEKALLEDLDQMLYYLSPNSIIVRTYPTSNGKIRHGLKYAIAQKIYGEFGQNYHKKDYEKSLANNAQKNFKSRKDENFER